MTPFLVTRQVFAGAGKVGWECENASLTTGNSGNAGFQISQRADFFSELVSIDTMNRRPLINTRDEPHADPSKFRRFHVIVGDANLSEFATWLKMGTTALVLESLQEEPIPTAWSLNDPLKVHRTVSRDTSFKWEMPLANGKTVTAVELQLRYVEWVKQHVDLSHPEKKKVWEDWKETLEILAITPLQCRDRLDWTAKYFLLDEFRKAEDLSWTDPWLQSIDLEYHLLKREEGLFYALEASGQMKRIISEAEVIHALQQPPTSTRAYLRGKCVQKFAKSVKTAQWDNMVLEYKDREYRLDLSRAFAGLELDELIAAIDRSATIADFVKYLAPKQNL
jgi:proteasome accessory factor A